MIKKKIERVPKKEGNRGGRSGPLSHGPRGRKGVGLGIGSKRGLQKEKEWSREWQGKGVLALL